MNEKKTMTFKADDYDTLDKICDMIYEKNITSLKELRFYIQEDLNQKEIKEFKDLNRFFEAHVQLLTLYLDGDLQTKSSSSFGYLGDIV